MVLVIRILLAWHAHRVQMSYLHAWYIFQHFQSFPCMHAGQCYNRVLPGVINPEMRNQWMIEKGNSDQDMLGFMYVVERCYLHHGVRAVVHRLSFITGLLHWIVNLFKFSNSLSLRHLIMYFFRKRKWILRSFPGGVDGDWVLSDYGMILTFFVVSSSKGEGDGIF